jgi:hypothetical protein
MSKNTGAILEESPVAKAITIRGTKIKWYSIEYLAQNIKQLHISYS